MAEEKKPVLVIMAAGMGSRYGGLKQIDPVDEYGNIIMDFSIFDAKEAGFEKVVFIIKKAIEKEFKENVGRRMERHIQVEYVFQELHKQPALDGAVLEVAVPAVPGHVPVGEGHPVPALLQKLQDMLGEFLHGLALRIHGRGPKHPVALGIALPGVQRHAVPFAGAAYGYHRALIAIAALLHRRGGHSLQIGTELPGCKFFLWSRVVKELHADGLAV